MNKQHKIFKNVKAFKTSLQHLFSVLKYSKNKTEFESYKKEHEEALKKLDPAVASAMITFLGDKLRFKKPLLEQLEKEKEEIDMCQAITELIEDGRKEGRSEGEKLTIIAIVRRKKDEGIDCETISAFLDEGEQIQKIYHILEENPDWTNDQIYETLKA